MKRLSIFLALLYTLLAGCVMGNRVPLPTPTQAGVQTVVPTDTPIIPSDPSSTSAPAAYWIQPGVPASIIAAVEPVLIAEGLTRAETAEGAGVRVVIDPGPEAALTAQWVYVAVAPYRVLKDSVNWDIFKREWTSASEIPVTIEPGPYSSYSWIFTPDVVAMLNVRIGPTGGYARFQLHSGADANHITDSAWQNFLQSIIPFEALEPRWHVISLYGEDGVFPSPIDKSFNVDAYPLTVQIGVIANGEVGQRAVTALQQSGAWQTTNRDPAQLTSVVMTGVTALSRAVAMQIETHGMDYPAREIMPFFADADVLHTSNEASFTPDCPEQDWFGEPKFCEHRKYYELFRTIGLDIVELTGNHNLDYGIAPALNSLDVYDAEGLPYFGGGRNLEDSKQARILTLPDGTRVAFIGCNSAGPYTAWATDQTPGAAPCEDWGWIKERIASLKANNEADIVIVTLQHTERDSYEASDQQRTDFEALAAAGADIVSGSQAHWPQGFSFVDGKFIHFGVGNVFFDQIDLEGNRQMFADKHIFYNGRHISTILFTGYFEEVAQPRPMTPEEREAFLRLIFAASGW